MASESASPEMLTGAQAIVRSLELMGVEVIFGVPGGAILHTFDPLYDSKMRFVLTRHEQGAGHAAEGYAETSGKVGVCIVTSGPGATNIVTPIMDAYMDSIPMVVITGQVASTAIGTDAFQETDIRGITMPITKHNYLITRPEDIPGAIRSAFEIASTGRPGPVLIDVSKDAQAGVAPFIWNGEIELPGYRPTVRPHGKQLRAAADLIRESSKPVLYVGGGVVRAEAWEELGRLVEIAKIPVVTTLKARGVIPDSNPLNMGMPGMHGTVAAVGALQRSDLLITIGARFDDRVTGAIDSFAPNAKVIHADVDPAEIGKNRAVDVPVVGDAKAIISGLTEALVAEEIPDFTEWQNYLFGLKERYPLDRRPTDDGVLSPQEVIARIGELTGDGAYWVTGVGQHQMWAAQFLPFDSPRHWATSGGAGTMGYGIPSGMGVKAAHPDDVVWVIDGDGCFQMTNQEITTCTLENLPIKIAVIGNNTLGMVRQWQTLFYNERYSSTDLHTERVPDFVKLAEAMGAYGIRVDREDQVDDAIKKALEINDRPVVVDFRVHKDAMVWPMVAAGTSNDDIMIARDMAPDWEGN